MRRGRQTVQVAVRERCGATAVKPPFSESLQTGSYRQLSLLDVSVITRSVAASICGQL